MFAIGGLWQGTGAAQDLANTFGSATTLDDQKKLLNRSVDLLRGVLNTISGFTGAAEFHPHENPHVAKTSSVTWAISEGVNVVQQMAQAISKGKTLDKEQLVHLGQIVGSGLKFGGIVASLKGASGSGPIIAQTVGSAASLSSGVLNLQNKGYDLRSTAAGYYNSVTTYLRSMSGLTGSEHQNDEAV
jgi:hypothetical protein